MIWNFRERWFVGLCVRVKRHMYLYWCSHARSRPRAPSQRNTHMCMKTVSTPHVCWGQIVINMGHLSVYVRQRSHWVQARVMFPYTWVMSLFTMSHVCIYVVHTWIYVSIYTLYAWIRVSIHMNHVFYTYNREYTKHKLQLSCSYIHASCLYLQYVVSL